MINRIFKFYVQQLSNTPAEITIKFNSVEIFSGTMPTITTNLTGQLNWQTDAVCEYIGTTNLVGNVPFELSVTSGTVKFGRIGANYSGYQLAVDRSDPANPVQRVVVSPVDFYGEVKNYSIETDGKVNVKINGIDQVRNVIDPEQIGDWWYSISQNETFTCDIFVDPDKIITIIPE